MQILDADFKEEDEADEEATIKDHNSKSEDRQFFRVVKSKTEVCQDKTRSTISLLNLFIEDLAGGSFLMDSIWEQPGISYGLGAKLIQNSRN